VRIRQRRGPSGVAEGFHGACRKPTEGYRAPGRTSSRKKRRKAAPLLASLPAPPREELRPGSVHGRSPACSGFSNQTNNSHGGSELRFWNTGAPTPRRSPTAGAPPPGGAWPVLRSPSAASPGTWSTSECGKGCQPREGGRHPAVPAMAPPRGLRAVWHVNLHPCERRDQEPEPVLTVSEQWEPSDPGPSAPLEPRVRHSRRTHLDSEHRR
jgi:hypothetical protein